MDEFDLVSDAISAVRLIQGVYGTSHEAATRIDEVAQILRLRANRLTGSEGAKPANALALAVADAICTVYGTPL